MKKDIKIYFAASIRGGRQDQALYQEIIKILSKFGTVLTEHFGKKDITSVQGTGKSSAAIYQKDMAWITEADVIVAEVTQPSLGVGYEIAKAEEMGKKIICFYRPTQERTLSAMLAGNPNITVRNYQHPHDLYGLVEEYFRLVAKA